MLDSVLKKAFILYLCLTLVEYGLTAFGGSLLKIYGYILIVLWLLLKKGKIPILKTNRPLRFLIFYLFYSFVTLLWSADSAMGGYYFFSMANMVILIVIASSLSWQKEDVSLLLTAFQIAAAVFCILLLVQDQGFEGLSRATLNVSGNEEDPNNIAAMLLVPTIISVWKILNNQGIKVFKKRRFVVFNYVFIGLNITAMLMLGSRGALISALTSTVFLLLFNNRISDIPKKGLKSITFLKTIVVIIAILFIVIPYIDPDILQRLTIGRIQADKGSDRLIIWGIAIKEFVKAPLTGIGLGSFQAITQKGVHNQFLIVLVETGIVGFLLFVGGLIGLLRKTLKKNEGLLCAILVGTMVVIFFLDSYNKKFLWNPILISVIVLKMKSIKGKNQSLQNEKRVNEYSYLQ